MQRVAAVLCAAVALCDLGQPLVLPWVPKMWGALAGGVIYAALAGAVWTGVRWPAWIAVVMPLVPLTVLVLSEAGVALPVVPDDATKAVLVVQGLAAAACLAWLVGRPRSGLDPHAT